MRRNPADLTPYTDCPEDEALGVVPLAIGWLDKRQPFATGTVSDKFITALLPFCKQPHTVYATPKARPCPLCHEQIEPFGRAQLRTIGQDDIYAAPDLLHHYVTAHDYKPPQQFIQAVLDCPAGSPAHRAIINTLP